MFLTMMKSKIHRATVTESNLNYVGSITIDAALMRAAGILPGEKVQVVNNNNGARLETYTIEGEENSGIICLNGAAARLVQPGDSVIIITYALVNSQQAVSLQPVVVMVDQHNRIVECKSCELHGQVS